MNSENIAHRNILYVANI